MSEYRNTRYSRADGKRVIRLETRDQKEDSWEGVVGDIHDIEEGVDGTLQHIDTYVTELAAVRKELWSEGYTEEVLDALHEKLSKAEKNQPEGVERSMRNLAVDITHKMREQGLYSEEENLILGLQHLPDIRSALQAVPDVTTGFWNDVKASGASTTKFTKRAPISLSGEVMRLNSDPKIVLRAVLLSGTAPTFQVLYHELIHRKQAQDQKELPAHITTLNTFTQEVPRALAACSAFFALAAVSPENTSLGASVAGIVLVKGFLDTLRGAQRFLRNPRSALSKHTLLEIQAHTADRELRGAPLKAGEIRDTMSEYPVTEFVPVDHVIIGFQQLEELRALGATHEDITALVMRSHWNDEQMGYDTLQARIEYLAQQKRLSRSEVEGLVDEYRLKKMLRAAKVRVAAQREVESLFY